MPVIIAALIGVVGMLVVGGLFAAIVMPQPAYPAPQAPPAIHVTVEGGSADGSSVDPWAPTTGTAGDQASNGPGAPTTSAGGTQTTTGAQGPAGPSTGQQGTGGLVTREIVYQGGQIISDTTWPNGKPSDTTGAKPIPEGQF